jgi:hypothetical protein
MISTGQPEAALDREVCARAETGNINEATTKEQHHLLSILWLLSEWQLTGLQIEK